MYCRRPCKIFVIRCLLLALKNERRTILYFRYGKLVSQVSTNKSSEHKRCTIIPNGTGVWSVHIGLGESKMLQVKNQENFVV